MAGLINTFKTACLFALLVVCACNTALAVPLWEIEGADNRIRLLGSIHFLRAEDYPLPRAIIDAYREADVIVLELALDTITPTDLLRVQQELAMDPRGRRLKELVDADVYQQVRAMASAFDFDIDMLSPFEPWFAALQITQLRLLQLGFDGSYGIDAHMLGMARTDGKPVIGLETLDEQLRMLDTLPAEDQQRFLLQTVKDAGTLSDDLEQILAAWRQGDVKTLDALLLEGLSDQQAVYDRLLVQRNRRWAKTIMDMMNDSRNYLVIVGALHLTGKDSVQDMLEQAGVRVRRVR